MKKVISIFVLFVSIVGCTLIRGYDHFVLTNEYDRHRLKPKYSRYDDLDRKDGSNLLNFDAIYYHRSIDHSINMKFYMVYRFFKDGRYAFYAYGQQPIVENDSYEIMPYNNLEKATWVGHYKMRDSVVITEYPNHVFAHGGVRQYHKLKISSNGDLLLKRETGSRYWLFKKIDSPSKPVLPVEPDW